ncbi:hypothetical protein Tco_1095643, partial [Tanacetum coccineum]
GTRASNRVESNVCQKYKDKITKADLEGPTFELLKNGFKNNIKLEYNMEQCYLAMTDITEWANPEALKSRKEVCFSVTNIKAARYEQEGIEEMITHLWRPSIHKYEKCRVGYSSLERRPLMRIKVDKKYGYEYLKKIVVKRSYQKEYTFVEADFLRLNQNDIEDLYLLKIQYKMHNIDGDDEFD